MANVVVASATRRGVTSLYHNFGSHPAIIKSKFVEEVIETIAGKRG